MEGKVLDNYAKQIRDYVASYGNAWKTTGNIEVLRQYIVSILNFISLSQEDLARLTSDIQMVEWAKVFTHKSIDEKNNYEGYERFGDPVSTTVFIDHVRRQYPQLDTPLLMSRQVTTKMSGEGQGVFTVALGMESMLRIDETKEVFTNKILGDIFEAFFGCLYNVGNNSTYYGAGSNYTYNMMSIFLHFNKIDPTLGKDATTQFKELFDKLQLAGARPTAEKPVELPGGKIKIVIKTKATGEILGTAEGFKDDEKAVNEKAHEEALKTLAKSGVTEEKADAAKKKRDEMLPELEKQKARVQLILDALSTPFEQQSFGLKTLSSGSTHEVTLTINKIKDGDITRIPIQSANSENATEAQIQVLKSFADSLSDIESQIMARK